MKRLFGIALSLCAVSGCLPTSLNPFCAELDAAYQALVDHVADLECEFLGECGS